MKNYILTILYVYFSKAMLLAQHDGFLDMDIKVAQCFIYDFKRLLVITKGSL